MDMMDCFPGRPAVNRDQQPTEWIREQYVQHRKQIDRPMDPGEVIIHLVREHDCSLVDLRRFRDTELCSRNEPLRGFVKRLLNGEYRKVNR